MLSSKTIRKTQSTCIDSDQSSIKAPSQGCTWRSERKNFWLQIQSKEIKKNSTCTLARNTSIYVSKNTPPEANIHKKTIWLNKNATCWENIWGKLMFTLSGIWLSKITLFWTLEFPFESFKIDSLYRKWKFVSKAGREMSFSRFSWRRNSETVFFVVFICLNDKPLVPYASFTLECSSLIA